MFTYITGLTYELIVERLLSLLLLLQTFLKHAESHRNVNLRY